MKLKIISQSPTNKELDHKKEVYRRFKRLRRYKHDKRYSEMKMFQSINGCTKCY